jgi:hypothetical protein
MNKIDTAIQLVKNTVKEQLDLDLVFREESSVEFFPQFMKVGNVYEIKYNRDMEVLLWLYNMVFYNKTDSCLAITHYLLYYACLDKELYDKAALHLQAFEEELVGVRSDEGINNHLTNQLSFIMLHEIYHVLFRYRPSAKEQGLDFERQRQFGIKNELAEMFKSITPEELIVHPKVQPRVKALFTYFMPKKIKAEIISQITKNMVSPEDYDTKVLGKDSGLLEELACDRSAWQFIMGLCRSIGTSKEEMFDLHCSLFVALTATFVDNAFLSYYFPEKHHRLQYDAKTIIIRQNSFKRLDIDIPVEYTKEVSNRYKDVSEYVERVYQETVNSFINYAKDLGGIYENGNDDREIDNDKRDELEDKMHKIICSVMG